MCLTQVSQEAMPHLRGVASLNQNLCFPERHSLSAHRAAKPQRISKRTRFSETADKLSLFCRALRKGSHPLDSFLGAILHRNGMSWVFFLDRRFMLLFTVLIFQHLLVH